MQYPYILDKLVILIKNVLRWHNSLEYGNTRVLIDTTLIFMLVTVLACIITAIFFKEP